ncbi:MAG: 4-alpha-glucanotransferase [Aquificaceae bacterium]|nr:4-alpha-glucanotransferase [Aquificaceae bacterium]
MGRVAGLLLPVSSLPSPYSVGDLGPTAYRFVDSLAKAGQSLWQVLPLNPTELAHGNSPYFSTSLFAGNPLLISPDLLCEEGLLKPFELDSVRCEPTHRVDYRRAYAEKEHLLTLAFERFRGGEDFEAFCQENAYWLEDYVKFSVIRKAERRPWWQWSGHSQVCERELLKEKFLQFVFFKQWSKLKQYANSKGISIVGDMPIYPAQDSCDVWSNQRLFKLGEGGLPLTVAGVPPDYFSQEGQLWGNPVYNWQVLKEEGFSWWLQRIRHNLKLFDLLRFDHFRGFSAFYQVPYGSKTARQGWWEKAPGHEFLQKVKEEFAHMPFLAEDLGTIDRQVSELRRSFGIPGMRVLVFAFFEQDSTHLPHHHEENSVVYTSTHDTMPVEGWFYQELNETGRKRVLDYLGYAPESISRALIRLAYMSVARYCIVPVQDLLGLGPEGRINWPGTVEGNWEWRMKSMLSQEAEEFLLSLCHTYGRGSW